MRGGQPEPVPHGLVEQLTAIAAADGTVRFRSSLHEGQEIRVTAGHFADLVGKLERLDDQRRVRVLLEIMGGRVPILLPEASVMPADKTA
jgi:transcription antitermination factor NusG